MRVGADSHEIQAAFDPAAGVAALIDVFGVFHVKGATAPGRC